MYCPVVLACDEAYAMQLATTLRSIVESNRKSWPLEFIILAFAFPKSVQAKVAQSLPKGSASIQWISVNLDAFSDFSTLEHISKVTFARLLIPRLLPQTTTRLLYLDADLLVLSDLAPLLETDLEPCVIGAVMDGLDPEIKANVQGLERAPRVAQYFNAGVLLIDLAKWREKEISERALEYLRKFPDSPFSDQDALNVACDGIWKSLDRRWNIIDHVEQVNVARISDERRPWILHFATWKKPWNYRYPNANAAYYDDFRNRTLFARTLLEKYRDASKASWTRCKRLLKGYSPTGAVFGPLQKKVR
jgi:lipopolysaccharide biosynthesis glycosyltransferase